MYQVIENRQSVPDIYADSLVSRGVVNHEDLQKDVADHTTYLNDELKRSDNITPTTSYLEGHWKGLVQASQDKITEWDTGIQMTISGLELDKLAGLIKLDPSRLSVVKNCAGIGTNLVYKCTHYV